MSALRECRNCANWTRLQPDDETAPEGTCGLPTYPGVWPTGYWPHTLQRDSCGKFKRREIPDPCTEEAREQECSCTVPFAGSHDIDPPEPKRDKHCPLHGWARDPDDERDRRRDDKLTGDA